MAIFEHTLFANFTFTYYCIAISKSCYNKNKILHVLIKTGTRHYFKTHHNQSKRIDSPIPTTSVVTLFTCDIEIMNSDDDDSSCL